MVCPDAAARPASPRTLVLGVGNLLLGDEGFGIHAVKRLEGEGLPASVTLLDGGTGGVDLLERMVGFDFVILIDAVRVGTAIRTDDAQDLGERGSEATWGLVSGGEGRRNPAPGEVVVFRLDRVELTNPDPSFSLHGCSLGGLIRLARALGLELPEIIVVGLVPHSVGWSTTLSQPAQAGLDEAVTRVRGLLAGRVALD